MAMAIKGKNPDKGSLQNITSTTVDGGDDPDREALDVNVKNANDIEVKMTGEGLATSAKQADLDAHNASKVSLYDSNGNAVQATDAIKILDKDGTNKLVINSDGKITITNTSFGVSSITAGETHIGEVGGSSIQIAPTVTVDTAAYTAGDVIGGKLTLTNAMRVSGGTGILQSLFVMDASGQKPALEILIFNADPSASTLTDQSAISIHANDKPKVIRRMSVATSDYVAVGAAGSQIYIADLSPGSRMVSASGSANLYAAIVATGAPDFVASTDLTVRFGFMRD